MDILKPIAEDGRLRAYLQSQVADKTRVLLCDLVLEVREVKSTFREFLRTIEGQYTCEQLRDLYWEWCQNNNKVYSNPKHDFPHLWANPERLYESDRDWS